MDKVYIVGIELGANKVVWMGPNDAQHPQLQGQLERAVTYNWKDAQYVRDLLAAAEFSHLARMIGGDMLLTGIALTMLHSYAGKYVVFIQPVEETTYAYRGQPHRKHVQLARGELYPLTADAESACESPAPRFIVVGGVAVPREGELTTQEVRNLTQHYRVNMVEEEQGKLDDLFMQLDNMFKFTDLDTYYDSFVIHGHFITPAGLESPAYSLTVTILNLLNLDAMKTGLAVAA